MTREVPSSGGLTREFTVAVFVVHEGRVLLHWHAKLGMWLPPGGHIEPNELPDEAAVREVLEETGIAVRLVSGAGLAVDYPVQLARPAGIQLEDIGPGHQHIDLVYFAEPVGDVDAIPPNLARDHRVGWYALSELEALGANEEIQAWCRRVVASLG
ncbi:MAG: NUDIX domain-containing protein [Chloroflexota bacterium]